MKDKFQIEITSMMLHIIAMVCMLCDHLWATVIPRNDWLTCIGRIAFPIFAFLIVEGYFYTHNLKKYIGRLFIFAIISEIPFNLLMGSSVFYPIHQNVLWTFLIGIGLIYINEKIKEKNRIWLRVVTIVVSIAVAFFLGLLTMVDYYHAGVFTVLVFYFFRGRKWWNFLAQFLLLSYINIEVLSGYAYEIALFGNTYYFVRQGFALVALLFIWLYRGKQGPYNRIIKSIYYWFYPVHLLFLVLIRGF